MPPAPQLTHVPCLFTPTLKPLIPHDPEMPDEEIDTRNRPVPKDLRKDHPILFSENALRRETTSFSTVRVQSIHGPWVTLDCCGRFVRR
jgi:hypothetical protein